MGFEKLNDLCGLIVHKNEKGKLLRLCLDYNIPILYTEPFVDGKEHPMWGLTISGIGLVGIAVMRNLSVTGKTIFRSVVELEQYLLSE